MAIIHLSSFDVNLLSSLDNFVEYSHTESIHQYGFIFQKNNRKLHVYFGCKTGIHSAHLEIDHHIVSVLDYYKPDCIMLYDQNIYFEHERIGRSKKIIEMDTKNIKINVSLLDNLSPARSEWLDASTQSLRANEFRVLKDGIRCTSEAVRGDDIFYKCLFCETMISSTPEDSVACKCRHITIDVDYARLHVHDFTKIQVLQVLKKTLPLL